MKQVSINTDVYTRETISIDDNVFYFELKWSAIVPNSRGELWYELVRKPRYLKKMYKYQLEQQNQ